MDMLFNYVLLLIYDHNALHGDGNFDSIKSIPKNFIS